MTGLRRTYCNISVRRLFRYHRWDNTLTPPNRVRCFGVRSSKSSGFPFTKNLLSYKRTVANPTFQDVTLPSITINRTIRNSWWVVALPALNLRLANSVGSTFPYHNDFTGKLSRDCPNAWLIGRESAELFRVSGNGGCG